MSDNAKKPEPDPERLVIEDDPGEALDRLLGKKLKADEWADYTPGREYPPATYDVEVEEAGEQAVLRVELTGKPNQRDDGWPLSPYAAIRRVRRVS
jgi:hypothetical protein